jgi:hypothetical protein
VRRKTQNRNSVDRPYVVPATVDGGNVIVPVNFTGGISVTTATLANLVSTVFATGTVDSIKLSHIIVETEAINGGTANSQQVITMGDGKTYKLDNQATKPYKLGISKFSPNGQWQPANSTLPAFSIPISANGSGLTVIAVAFSIRFTQS